MSSDAYALLEPAAVGVRDPVSGRSVWLARMITDARLEGGSLKFTLTFTAEHSADDRVRIQSSLRNNLYNGGFEGEIICNVRFPRGQRAAAPQGHDHGHSHGHGGRARMNQPQGKDPVRGMSGPGMQPHGGPINKQPIPGVRHLVAVASGKGGVGKSTVSVNLACGLAKLGYKVGLMDADIYGPSLPMMMNVNGKPMANQQQQILPLISYGVRCMSIGFLAPEDEPIIWRGPMVMGVVNQFLKQVAWGELDYLIVDLPPGTGDAQLTIIQATPISGSVIVTTPQDIALLDARRGVEMFRKLDVPVLGVVENMSWFELPDGTKTYPFGQGGGQRMADRYGVDLLAQVPLEGRVREGGDHGAPAVLGEGGPLVERLTGIAQAVAERLPVS